MKLMNWSKIAQMLAPEFKSTYANYFLVLGKKEDSSAVVRANYNYLKNNLKDCVEVKNNNSSYLLINSNSSDLVKAENMVNKIKEEEFLDSTLVKEELELDNLHVHKPNVNCGLCYKPLSAERSSFSTLGPVCEHKVQNIIEQDEVPEEDKFSSIYSESVESGEMMWLKTDKEVLFVEICKNSKHQITFLDRKNLEKELKTNNNYTEVLEKNLHEINKDQIKGVSRVTPKKNEDKLFDDLMDIFK
jgi:hypothetical protein